MTRRVVSTLFSGLLQERDPYYNDVLRAVELGEFGMELRPRYSFTFSGSPEEAETRLCKAIKSPESTVKGRIKEGQIEIMMAVDEPHYWSPELRARIAEKGGKTLIRGHFAPRPHVWTMFMALFAFIIFSTGVGAVFGICQWMLDFDPWAFWTVPVGVLCFGLVWLGGRLGQTLGGEDMERLRDFVSSHLAS